MFSFIMLVLIIGLIILITVISIVLSIFKSLFRNPFKNREKASKDTSLSQNKKKIFHSDEGEYVDYEEINDEK